MDITRDDVADSKVSTKLLNNNIDKVYAIVYDTLSLYSILEDNNIAIIKPRRNARYTNHRIRNDNVKYIKELGYKLI